MSNLEIVNKFDHRSDHKQKYDCITVKCIECNTDFFLDPIQHRTLVNNQRNKNTAGPFCSKECIGIYGKRIQLST